MLTCKLVLIKEFFYQTVLVNCFFLLCTKMCWNSGFASKGVISWCRHRFRVVWRDRETNKLKLSKIKVMLFWVHPPFFFCDPAGLYSLPRVCSTYNTLTSLNPHLKKFLSMIHEISELLRKSHKVITKNFQEHLLNLNCAIGQNSTTGQVTWKII